MVHDYIADSLLGIKVGANETDRELYMNLRTTVWLQVR